MRIPRPALLASAVITALTTTSAHASECGEAPASTCIDSDALWFTPGPTTFFSLASGMTLAPRRFGFGLATGVQNDPLVLRKSASGPAGAVTEPAIGVQVNTSMLFSYGVTDRVQVDVAAPVTFFQNGSGISTKDGSATRVPANGVRDLRIGAAYALLGLPRTGALRGLGVVARFDLSIPTGERDSFGGDRGLVAIPTIALEDRLGPMVFGANFGARLRKTTAFFDKNVGSQAYLGLGVAGLVDKRETLAVTGEVFALPSLVESGNSPIGWLAGVRWSGLWGGDLVVHGGGGGSFRSGENAQLLEPSFRAVLDIRYAPLSLDRDSDGIPDRDDKCVDDPEDRDNFEDTDGCPEPDNDKDGIPDKVDRCPDVAEDFDAFQDDDGCPEPDRDFDGIKDAIDKCPDKPEDKNGYEDDDGCPEGGPPPALICADGKPSPKGATTCDVDHDGRPDDLDACPLQPEDVDGIADADGCPERDADEDGIGDQVDKCPLEAETIDGKDDADGCPEPGARSVVRFEAGAIEVDGAVRFAPGSAVVPKAMTAQIALVAQRLQGLVDRGVEKIVIETWADTAGETKPNEALAQKRADALVAALVATGIPEALVKGRPGDLADPPAKPKANWLVTVRTKRKAPLPGVAPAAPVQPAPTAPAAPAAPTAPAPPAAPAAPNAKPTAPPPEKPQ
ncbi:MAG: thrombospondin type 3 repeat-containing protein [Deltaproteobacteria bacterium]|nr:thrombospondin type 3 repeat-containing protein [Deltaproteobacteria bacterium]